MVCKLLFLSQLFNSRGELDFNKHNRSYKQVLTDCITQRERDYPSKNSTKMADIIKPTFIKPCTVLITATKYRGHTSESNHSTYYQARTRQYVIMQQQLFAERKSNANVSTNTCDATNQTARATQQSRSVATKLAVFTRAC